MQQPQLQPSNEPDSKPSARPAALESGLDGGASVFPEPGESPAVAVDAVETASTASLVRSGVAWNSVYQLFSSLVAFVSMLVLVRIIPPREYGRYGAISGLLALLNAAGCRMFVAQALQLPGGAEPDWSQHLAFAVRMQSLLFLLCNGIGLVSWFLPAYRPVALLLHIISFGFFIDAAAQVSSLMLERALNFKRLRILSVFSTAVYALTILPLGFAGHGALAMVLSSMAMGLPLVFDLWWVRRWRPRPGWWRNFDWRSYKPALQFGALNVSSNALTSARSGLEFAVLPLRAGYTAMGLWSRAQALFTISIARLLQVLQQTVYPLLPRYAAQRDRYPRYATLFAQVMIWLLVPAAIYLGLEGKTLSRILYGNKWIAADPMIWPGVVLGSSLWIFLIAGTVNVAANRLRVCFSLDVLAACMCLPALGVAWFGRFSPDHVILAYAWAFAAGQCIAGLANFVNVARFVKYGWTRRVLAPIAVSSAVAAAGMIAIQRLGWPLIPQAAATAIACVFLNAAVLRIGFAERLREVLSRLPGGARIRRLLLLQQQAGGGLEVAT